MQSQDCIAKDEAVVPNKDQSVAHVGRRVEVQMYIYLAGSRWAISQQAPADALSTDLGPAPCPVRPAISPAVRLVDVDVG